MKTQLKQLNLEIEQLRAARNRGSKHIGNLKSQGLDASIELEKLKAISLKLKEKESLVKQLHQIEPKEKEVNTVISTEVSSALRENHGGQIPIEPKCQHYKGVNLELCREVEANSTVFPQLRLAWIMPWIDSHIESGEVITVVCFEKSKPVGFALFLKRRFLSLTFITQCPVRWGDFYSFSSLDGYDACSISSSILSYIEKMKEVDLISLDQVSSQSNLYASLRDSNYCLVKTSNIYTSRIQKDVDVLEGLSSKFKTSIKKKLASLHQIGKLRIEFTDDVKHYLSNDERVREIFKLRWGYQIPDFIYSRRNMSLKNVSENSGARFFFVYLDDELVAFRVGFLYKKIFFEWKSGHDPLFNDYSLGEVVTYLLQREIRQYDIIGHNFMSGDYPYKRRWGAKDLTSEKL